MVLVPQDALDVAVRWAQDLVTRVPDLAGFTVGGTQLRAALQAPAHSRPSHPS